MNILRIDSSMRSNGSVSRELTDQLIQQLRAQYPEATVTTRDLAHSDLPFVNEAMIGGFYIPDSERTPEQHVALTPSDVLVDELLAADILVFGVPIYNFGVPAALKAWIDLIARYERTFRFGDNGPEGLVNAQKAYVIITSGSVASGSDIDFATNYMRQALNFIGIQGVEFIAADALNRGADEKLAATRQQIATISQPSYSGSALAYA